jgi:hypothetical protein
LPILLDLALTARRIGADLFTFNREDFQMGSPTLP